MKLHRITKSFRGSQDGHNTEHFEKDTVRHLSDSLAVIVVKAGWAEPHIETQESKASGRDTKVIQPDETKAKKEAAPKAEKEAAKKEAAPKA